MKVSERLPRWKARWFGRAWQISRTTVLRTEMQNPVGQNGKGTERAPKLRKAAKLSTRRRWPRLSRFDERIWWNCSERFEAIRSDLKRFETISLKSVSLSTTRFRHERNSSNCSQLPQGRSQRNYKNRLPDWETSDNLRISSGLTNFGGW